MVNVLADGENSHRLENADGQLVGSIRNRAIRLRGLVSEEEALAASCVLWSVLDALLARQFPGWLRHTPDAGQLRLTHDGAYEWITDGRKPLARLVRPSADGTAEQAFGLELVLPSYASEGVAISAAPALASALADWVRRTRPATGSAAPPRPRDHHRNGVLELRSRMRARRSGPRFGRRGDADDGGPSVA